MFPAKRLARGLSTPCAAGLGTLASAAGLAAGLSFKPALPAGFAAAPSPATCAPCDRRESTSSPGSPMTNRFVKTGTSAPSAKKVSRNARHSRAPESRRWPYRSRSPRPGPHRDRFAFSLKPFADNALFNRVAQLRHFNRSCHLPKTLHGFPALLAELAESSLGRSKSDKLTGLHAIRFKERTKSGIL